MLINKICRGRVYFNMKMIAALVSAFFKSSAKKAELIKGFECGFAKYIGVDYAIATSSGRTALYLCLKALGAREGDEIIVPSCTVREVIDVIILSGLVPVFVDISLKDSNMDKDLIEQAIGKRTRFILMTHIYGCACDIDPIMAIAKKHAIVVIEDAAQACGSEYKSKKTGSFGTVAYFSFGLFKSLNTLGGGMVVTNVKALAKRIKQEAEKYPRKSVLLLIKEAFFAVGLSFFTHPLPFSLVVYPVLFLLRTFGRSPHGHTLRTGRINKGVLKKNSFRFSAEQAAIGMVQFPKLDKINDARISNAEILNSRLNSCKNTFIFERDPTKKNIYLNYVIRNDNRTKLINKLFLKGIDVSPGQLTCCSDLADFKQFFSDCPNSRKMQQESIYLPVYWPLNEKRGHRQSGRSYR